MALLSFDADTLVLRIIAGALEKYEPTEQVKVLSSKIDELRSKVKQEQEKYANEYKEFLKSSVTPLIEELKKEVDHINKENYPELEKLKAGKVESAAPKV